jgi:DNA-binding transcriptional ArsR family regulator
MATEAKGRSLDEALDHPTRGDLIRLLWRRGDPATASELSGDLQGGATLPAVSYHCLVLEGADVIELDGEGDSIRPAYVVGGEHADEAVRRLGLRT